MSILMGRKDFPGNSTVTLTHSYTPHIEEFTKNADIVITALATLIFKGEMIKDGAVVIDVGITRVEDNTEKGYHLAGDVDFDSLCRKKQVGLRQFRRSGTNDQSNADEKIFLAYKHTIYKD